MSGAGARAWGVAAVLAVLVGWVFAPAWANELLAYDDGLYVTDNPRVLGGWSGETARWAMTSLEVGNWHPVTWWSHAGAVELFGVEPAGHHAVNVGLHAMASGVLLLTLYAATGCLWRSALVAALFGLHPLRVESVAWVAERKDVLFGLFYFLAIAAYVRWVRRPGIGGYLALCAAFLASLASKAMAVSLPAVLLLLDRWPLGRADPVRRQVLEKLPLFVMSILVGVAAIAAQEAGGALSSVEAWPWSRRLESAFVAYGDYFMDSFWPAGLAVFYPHPPGGESVFRVIVSVVGVAALGAVGLRGIWHREPVGVGALWFLGTLLPVIGIVTVGDQARADRYMYIPSVGLLLGVVWGVPSRWLARPAVRAVAVAAVVGALLACILTTRSLLPHWRDDEALFARALAVTSDNHVAHLNYGNAIDDPGRRAEQRQHFEQAVALDPGEALAHYDLARIDGFAGDHARAVVGYRRAIALDPALVRAWNNLGNALVSLGKLELADRAYEQALVVAPDHLSSLFNLGTLRIETGEVDRGLVLALRYLDLRPEDLSSRGRVAELLVSRSRPVEARRVLLDGEPLDARGLHLLARLHWEAGDERDAVDVSRKLLARAPDSANRRNDLAWMLATAREDSVRDERAALELASAAADATQQRDPDVLDTLAAALAATGDFDAAQRVVARATEHAHAQGRGDLVLLLEARAAEYRDGRAFRRGTSW